MSSFSLKFWGTRGSIPCPGPGTTKYGGNTTCFEIVCDDKRVIIDAGTGIRLLGKKIMIEEENLLDADLFFTHTHMDHSPGAKPLAERLSIPCYGKLVENDFSIQDESFKPDFILSEDEHIETEEYTIKPIHTPGHASNHYCFLIDEIKCLLSGDHIMDGSTVVIAPKDGNMNEYISSLKKLNDFSFDSIAPGHGNYIDNPYEIIEWTIQHRLDREEKVFKKLSKLGATGINRLLISVYNDVNPKLLPIAKWSLEAHLIKLIEDERVVLEKGKYRSLED